MGRVLEIAPLSGFFPSETRPGRTYTESCGGGILWRGQGSKQSPGVEGPVGL